MTQVRSLPYGTWPSPINAALIASDSIGLAEPRADGDACYWLEHRPAENGRSVLVCRRADGVLSDVTPAAYNVRSRVHEYGGGAYTVAAGSVYFSNFLDQRIYRQDRGGVPRALTPALACRYADFVVDAARQRLIAVREDHRQSDAAPRNALVTLDASSEYHNADGGRALIGGADFYASPRLNPAGTQLAWLSWDHPDMPWDGSKLWLADVVSDGSLHNSVCIAGNNNEAITQPEWSPDGVLHFISDRSGWWNLYRWQDGASHCLAARAADFGVPHWVFGQSTYAFLSVTTLVCTYTENSMWRLATLELLSGALTTFELPYTEFSGIRIAQEKILCSAGAPKIDSAIVLIDSETQRCETLRRATRTALDVEQLSTPQALCFPSAQGRGAYALYYPPHNPACVAPAGERPPLIVRGHGGPTSMTSSALNLGIQYWTNRGFAVLDVNYAGSSGFGRAYRDSLNGQWGVADVEDCVYGARFLVAQGLADGTRLAIRGGSAGGYTALCALAYHDTFRAAACLYGISNLETLAQDTHKFESHYLERLVGPYPARRDLYVARSPVHAVTQITAPVIFFQGRDDKVVPPNQAEQLVNALRAQGLPVAYLLFDGEGHGFRQAATIVRALEAELYFYAKIFGFTLADSVPAIHIDNLPVAALSASASRKEIRGDQEK